MKADLQIDLESRFETGERFFHRNMSTMRTSGTTGYIPPEVKSKQVKQDYFSDFYSLGVILYEMLFKEKPDIPSTLNLDSETSIKDDLGFTVEDLIE